MADANREIGVKITTSADLGAAKEASKEIKKTADVTAESNKETARAEQPVKKLTEAKGRLRDVVKGLGVEFPVFGRALSFLYSPLTILTAAVSVAAAKFIEFARSVAEAGRKQAQLEAMRDTLASVASIMKQMEAAKFSAAITAIGDAAQSVIGDLGRLNSKLDETRSRADTLDDLRLELQKQKIATAGAAGEDPSEAAGQRALADVENKADEAKAQREFRALQQKKKNQEDALRELEPQIARLQFTPDADLAAMKKRAVNQTAIAGDAEKEFAEQGPKLKDEVSDLQALLTSARKGTGVSIMDRSKYGLKGLGQGAVTQEIGDLIEAKSREYDALLKRKGFEGDKAQTLGQQVTHAEEQNAQIGRLRGAEDTLRKGIKDTDEEIKSTTDFNREALRLKRETRESAVREVEIRERKKAEEFQKKEQEKATRERERGRGRGRGDGASTGGGFSTGEFAQADTSGIAAAGTEAAAGIGALLATTEEMFGQITGAMEGHSEKLRVLEQRIADVAANV